MKGRVLSVPSKNPGHTLIESAREEKAFAIIMGTRGLSKIKKALLGSTSDYVLQHSEIPVIVVRKKEWERPSTPVCNSLAIATFRRWVHLGFLVILKKVFCAYSTWWCPHLEQHLGPSSDTIALTQTKSNNRRVAHQDTTHFYAVTRAGVWLQITKRQRKRKREMTRNPNCGS